MLHMTYQSGLTVEREIWGLLPSALLMPSTTSCSMPLPPPGTTATRTGGIAAETGASKAVAMTRVTSVSAAESNIRRFKAFSSIFFND
jgi:hypothetical protein